MRDLETHPKNGSLNAFRAAVPQSVSLALIYLLCGWLGYNLYQLVQQIAAYYVSVPVEDYWRVVENLREYQALHLGAFWRQHNEHRIIFPELIFATDMLAAHGREILTLAFSFIFYALTWAILSFTVMRDEETPFLDRCTAALLAGVITFWQGSALALARPFLLQWPLMQFGVVLAIFFLKKAADSDKTSYMAAAIGAAVVATYSSANALLLWPLLLAIGLAVRLTKRFIAALGISAIVFVGLYFIGYKFSEQTNVRALFAHPFYFIGFVGSYLSMPFGGMKSAGFGIAIGLVNLAVVTLLAVLAWRFRLTTETPVVVLFGYYSFTLLTVVITAAGRMEPADANFTTARMVRYLTVPFLNWAAVLLLVLWMSARLQWRLFTITRLTLLFSLLLLVSMHKLRNWQDVNGHEFANYQYAALVMENGLTDSEIITRIFPSPEFVRAYLPTLKKNHLSIFSRERDKWIGRNVTEFSGIRENKIAGAIISSYPVEHGIQLVGWVNADDARDPYPRIVLVNERGQIVGFGRRPGAGLPDVLHSYQTPESESWVALANLTFPSQTITAYAVTRGGLAPMEGGLMVPAFSAAAVDETGPPVPDIAWHMDKAWALNGIAVVPKYGWLPPVAAYGTWRGKDKSGGQIAGEFATPASACIVLPVLHGPAVTGASARLLDADSGSVLADFPFRNRDPLWTVWRVKLDPSVKHLRFVAASEGKGWGQWVAVSSPVACAQPVN